MIALDGFVARPATPTVWAILLKSPRTGSPSYFENAVLKKRPYLRKEWCIRVLENPLRSEPQEHNRYRFWGEIEELDGRYLRVVKRSRINKRFTTHFLIDGSSHESQLLPGDDSLYIDLSEHTSAESREVSEGVVLDYDSDGNLVGIDIDNASTKVQLDKLPRSASFPRQSNNSQVDQISATLEYVGSAGQDLNREAGGKVGDGDTRRRDPENPLGGRVTIGATSGQVLHGCQTRV